jgi:hypothetical protein
MYKSRAVSVASRLPIQRPFEIATVCIRAELFGLIADYPSQFNLYAPRFLYIGQAFRYSPDNAFYIFNQQIYFII